MTSKTRKLGRSARDGRGFMAVTAVLLLASGALAFSLAVTGAAALYADAVMRKELRIQAGLNANACLDTAKLMAAKDYFVSGEIAVRDFGCVADFTNDFQGHVSISVRAEISGVTERAADSLNLGS